MEFRLAWKDSETGRIFQGKPLFKSLAMAKEVARRMDERWPEFVHWAEERDAAAAEGRGGPAQDLVGVRP